MSVLLVPGHIPYLAENVHIKDHFRSLHFGGALNCLNTSCQFPKIVHLYIWTPILFFVCVYPLGCSWWLLCIYRTCQDIHSTVIWEVAIETWVKYAWAIYNNILSSFGFFFFFFDCPYRDENLADESPPQLITPISQSPELNGIESCDLPSHLNQSKGAGTGDSPDRGRDFLTAPTTPSPQLRSKHERNLSDGVGVAQSGMADLGHKRNLSDSQTKAMELSTIQVSYKCSII